MSEFATVSGLRVRRTQTPLDYATGIGFVIDRLDSERGAYFSSGIEFPDRYSRWDIAVIEPPLEFIGRGRSLTVRAISPRGEVLLKLLRPLLVGPDTTVTQDDARTLALTIAEPRGFFAEEERSLQPSVFSPLRRIIADFAGRGEGNLGLYGAFGYDLLFQFERVTLKQDRHNVAKDLHAYFADRILLVDRRKEVAFRLDYELAGPSGSTEGLGRGAFVPIPMAAQPRSGAITTDQNDSDYAAMVDRARERMRVGDIFEVVLSRSFLAPYGGKPSLLFRTMQRVNPSPYEFLIQLGDEQLIGASPEMFVRVEGRRVESCPISGTVRRGQNPMEDADNIRKLYNSDKDEVELTMCTDVDRNDKSRICEPGSIRLLGRRLIERYAGLFHTVDHVEGMLRPGFTGIDAFLSHMWAVTLTGAPKKAAVEIVESEESTPRRWYGGAIGALLVNGDINTGITIRTVHLENGLARYRAGATLVWDSQGLEEAEETRTKATAFFNILEPKAPPKKAEELRSFKGVKVVMIDNEDSFVHTLADYFRQTGAEVRTYRAGVPVAKLVAEKPDLVVHSPGPGRPEQFGVPSLVKSLAQAKVPQFGVCLGLQGIVEAFGGRLNVLDEPRHGKRWTVSHDGAGLFRDIPNDCAVGAYHSLVADPATFPASELEVTARNETGLVMAVKHRREKIFAVQFHPESILTMGGDVGHKLIRNVLAVVTGRNA
ncbi:MAG: anthranilate synthase component I [Alphaproteobacteria bacterium]|nr:anthranilate synthase component I [Alphaproteobacteria bacterium]